MITINSSANRLVNHDRLHILKTPQMEIETEEFLMKGLMRLFIAVNFNEEIKDNLFRLTQELKKNTTRGHFTHRDNFHLTLAFIGETKDLEHAIMAIENAVEKGRIPQFFLNLGGFGRFKGRDGDIYWVGVEQNQVLSELNDFIVRELRTYEFKVDDKEFKPHLTLGREIVLKQGYVINEFAKLIPAMTMLVSEIGLMKSERIDGKLVYTKVYYKNLR